jgi:hypothetical protein
MSGQKKESYVSHVESGSRSISSGVPIKEFMTRCCSRNFALARRMQGAPAQGEVSQWLRRDATYQP